MSAAEAAAVRPDIAAPPAFGEALRVYAVIGLVNFGGPAGQIALMHRVFVEERKWISEERFLHALNFCMLLPGPEAQQLATYVGWLLHGTRGGIAAGTLFVIPGLVVILALSSAYAAFRGTAWLDSLFFGLKAAVLAIVIEAVVRIGRRALKSRAAVAIAAAAFLAIFALRVPFPLIIVAAGLVGFAVARFAPGLMPAAGTAGADDRLANGVADRVRPTVGRMVRIVAVCGGLWAAPVVLLGLVFGFGGFYPQLGLFFSKMAVVTFGGAYAVLAYVADAAVTTYGWLKPGEMLDGLAMAETTPGPLIIVLSFVGYLGAFREATGLSPQVAGLVGGLLVAWVTFVPSFLWIFLGAPYMERLRGSRLLAGALTAITAAVVGVILNLSVWLGLHVLFGTVGTLELGPFSPAWPEWVTVDPWAVLLFALSAFALFRLRLGVVPTLVLASAAGVAIRLALPAT